MVPVACTLGDPRGVGPEVMIDAARRIREDKGEDVVLIGPDELDPGDLTYDSVGAWDGSEVDAGRAAYRAIRRAIESCTSGRASAMVTGPAHKPALLAAGAPYPGHTELLRDLTGAPLVGMLMSAERTALGGPLRVLLATTHVALREVPRLVTEELLVTQTQLLDQALRRLWGLSEPRLALCALNPHASDGGLFGDEEIAVLEPAVRTLEARGVLVRGPIPADTVFRRAATGEFDAVVAPYHDVGMAAFKTTSFGAGVNVTLGLPFVRTSPDHGTAFDIAGTGAADASSAYEAIALAVRLSAAGRIGPAAVGAEGRSPGVDDEGGPRIRRSPAASDVHPGSPRAGPEGS